MDYKNFDTRKYPTVSAQAGYNEWAKTYEHSVEDAMDLRLLERSQAISWQNMETAIDLACGTGRIGVWLKSKGVKSIKGIDLTEGMLRKAHDKVVYDELQQGDILATGWDTGSVDLCIEVLADEHLSDLKPLYAEASRLIKTGAYFVIVGYHPHFLMNGLVTHFHRENGDPIAIESYVHVLSDHVKAAFQANLSLVEMDEGIIDEEWLALKPKWEKYTGRPVSFLMIWRKV